MNKKRVAFGITAVVALSVLYGTAAYATSSSRHWDSQPGADSTSFGFSGANSAITEKTATSAYVYEPNTSLVGTTSHQQYQLQIKNAFGSYVSEGNLTVNTGSTGTWNNRAAGQYRFQLNCFQDSLYGGNLCSGGSNQLYASMGITY